MDSRIVRRYARALYEVAVRRGIIERVGQDVELIGQTLQANPRLLGLLSNPELLAERRRAVITDIFGSRVNPLTLQFCLLLVDKHRPGVLETLEWEFQKLADEAGAIVRARVQTAVPMTELQEERLIQQLSTLTGKRVILQSSVDPSLIGGAVVWIGDRVIDGSVTGYLSTISARIS